MEFKFEEYEWNEKWFFIDDSITFMLTTIPLSLTVHDVNLCSYES